MKSEIEMRRGDAAILLHANGDIGLLIPKLEELGEDEDAPDHVSLAMAFGIIARTPALRHIVMVMAEKAAEMAAQEDEPAVTQ